MAFRRRDAGQQERQYDPRRAPIAASRIPSANDRLLMPTCLVHLDSPPLSMEESFLLTGLRSSRYSTVQFFRTVLVLWRIQSCLEPPAKRPASSKSWRWSESAS